MISTPSYKIKDHDTLHTETDLRYVLRVRDMEDDDKPREKLLKNGVKTLNNPELLAVVLGHGDKKEDLMSLCNRVLSDYGAKALAYEQNPQHLQESLDIPPVKAMQIVACFELGRRFYSLKNGNPCVVHTSSQAYEHLKTMAHLKKEQLRGLYLNSRYQIVHDEVISTGSLTANIVHPREVFAPALEHGAVGVIIAHNHPSNSLEPTADDIDTTEVLVSAGKMLGIDLVDHLIISSDGYRSILNSTWESNDE